MSIRDRAGRSQGHNKVPSNGEAMTAEQVQPNKPSRKEELQVELKNEQEHDALQQQGIQFLNTIGDARKSIEDRTSETLFNWFKHQGFWPEWWHPSMAVRNGFIEQPEQTVEIPLVEYIRLKKMEKLGLIVTEVAECMEAVRKDDHRNEVEELADIDVRMHDYKGGFGLAEYGNPFKDTAADGFIQKMIANFQRPFRHGKKF